jgi:hypothetical protein
MKHAWSKNLIWLLLAFYLLGGHAGAHGLAWCLGADGHGHLERSAAACASSAQKPSCGPADACARPALARASHHHSAPECRHQPVTEDQAAFVPGSQPLPDVYPTEGRSAWSPFWPRLAVAMRESRTPRPAPGLPPTQALAALRTIVLLN